MNDTSEIFSFSSDSAVGKYYYEHYVVPFYEITLSFLF